MSVLRKEVPILTLGIVFGVLIAEYYLNIPVLTNIASTVKSWSVVIMGIAVAYSTLSLTIAHSRKVQRKEKGRWIYSLVLLGSLIIMSILGFVYGTGYSLFRNIYSNIALPVSAAMSATTAFFITTAAYRAFRANSVNAAIMLIVGVFVMFGNMPMMPLIFTTIKEWLVNVVGAAGYRGMWITFAIGMIGVALRSILGYERTAAGGVD